MTRLAGNLLLALLSIAFALGASEVMVRVVRPQLTYRFPQGMFSPDPVTSYGLTPGFDGVIDTPEFRTAIRVDAAGRREDRPIGAKPPGTTRLLMIGDSFTMGVGVEGTQTIARQLERALGAMAGVGAVEVVNAGVPGYGTVQEVAQLEARGLALAPDVVVLGFFVGNDVEDNAARPQIVQDGYLVGGDTPPIVGLRARTVRFLSLHSQLYHLVQPLKAQWVDGVGAASHAAGFAALYGADEQAGGWPATRTALARFAEVTRARGVRAVAIVIPDRVQVSPALWTAVVAETGVAAGTVDPAAPNRRVVAWLTGQGIPTLDLLPVLTAGGDGAQWYYPQDHHLTVAGTTKVVEALAPFVRAVMAGQVVEAR